MSKLTHSELKSLLAGADLTEGHFRQVKATVAEIPENPMPHEITPAVIQTQFFVALYKMVCEGNPDATALLEAVIPENNLPKVVRTGCGIDADGNDFATYKRTDGSAPPMTATIVPTES